MYLSIHPLDLGDLEVDASFVNWQTGCGTNSWFPTTAWLIQGFGASAVQCGPAAGTAHVSFHDSSHATRHAGPGCCAAFSKPGSGISGAAVRTSQAL